jgi:hypothetical protein
MSELRSVVLAVAWLYGLYCNAEDAPARLNFKTSGFSINALEAKPAEKGQQALMMFLPVSDGFAPNVNVMIQRHEGTTADYLVLSKKQAEALHFDVISLRQSGDSEVIFESTGELNNRKLQFYSRAILRNGNAYLATATATEAQWKDLAAELKACVDSFRLEGDGQHNRMPIPAPKPRYETSDSVLPGR